MVVPSLLPGIPGMEIAKESTTATRNR